MNLSDPPTVREALLFGIFIGSFATAGAYEIYAMLTNKRELRRLTRGDRRTK